MAIKAVNSRVKKTSSSVESAQSEIKKIEMEIKELDWLDQSEKELEEISELHSEIQEVQTTLEQLKRLKEEEENIEILLSKLPDSDCLPELQSILELDKAIDTMVNLEEGLKDLLDDKNYCEERLQVLESLDLSEIEELRELEKEIRDISWKLVGLQDLDISYSGILEKGSLIDEELLEAEKEREAAFYAIDICPTCRREWDDTCSLGE